jgi:hypothetical protein
MQLTAAAVTPPAEHAARRPAGAVDAVAADAGVGQNGTVFECFVSYLFALKTRAAVKWQRPLPECMVLAW